jgi:uncharacterized protein (TIGR00369 family)
MTETISPAHIPFVAGGPEGLFRMGELSRDGKLTRASMRTGPWMLGPDGEPCRGSLGVLADDILGYAVHAERPDGHWSVSTEISLDFCSQLPVDGTTLHGESHTVEFDTSGGLSIGRIVDSTGRTIALGSERVRFVPGAPAARAQGRSTQTRADSDALEGSNRLSRPDPRPGPRSTPDVLGATTRGHDGGITLRLAATLELSNPQGSLHGGISLCASEIAGLAILQERSLPLVTASIHIAYLRPVPVDGEVSFDAKVLHRGRTLGVAQVVSHDADGRACTLATVTCHAPS